jgi:multiple sugar transport system substrate-binding protein
MVKRRIFPRHRRWRAVPLVSLMLPVLLVAAACGSSGGGSTPAVAPQTRVAAPKTPTTITFVSWVGSQPTMKKFAKEFHALYPTITVNFVNVSADSEEQKLTTMVAGGTAPDAAYVDSGTVADFASRGVLSNLDPFIAQSKYVTANQYVPAFKNMNTFQGHMYGLPFDGESTAIFYRTDLFAQAGIQCCPKNWAEFQADAQRLTDPAKKQYGFALFGQEAAYYWYPWLWSAGGHLVSANGKQILFDSPQAQAAANYYIGLRKYSPPDYWNSNSWDGRVAFPNGQAAMYEAGSWFGGEMKSSFPKINGKWSSFPIPVNKVCATDLAGDSLVVFKSSPNADAAWLWNEFLSRKANVELWNAGTPDSTELPPITSLLNSPATYKYNPWLKGFAADMNCGFAEAGRVTQWGQIEQNLNTQFTKAIYGKITPSQALAQGAQQANSIIASGG